MDIRPSRVIAIVGLLALGACAAQSDVSSPTVPQRPSVSSLSVPPVPTPLPPSEPSSIPTSLPPSIPSDEQLIKSVRDLGKAYPQASLDEQVSALSTIK